MTAVRPALGLALLAAVLAAGCSKDKDVEPPAELVDFNATLAIKREWSLGAGADDVLRLGLSPAVEGERAFVAGESGNVFALALPTGRTQWRVRLDAQVSGGPGAGDGLVVVGTRKGEVVALAADSGAERWRVKVAGEILSRPAVGGGRVVVHTVDGRLTGLDAADGRAVWSFEQPAPRLTVRGSAAPVIEGDAVFAAFDSGKVAALTLREGDLLWTATVSAPSGRTELQRLVDIDGPVRVAGEDVFVAGFQGRAAMIARSSGQIWWGRDYSTYRSVALDDESLYLATADGVVVSLARRDGTERWRNDVLARRGLSGPAVDGDAVVVGDYEGYLHWFDRASGELLGRTSTDGNRISNAPVAAGGLVLVQTDAGGVYAFRARPRGSR
jgi:outer membrane protein assembly factor BamB